MKEARKVGRPSIPVWIDGVKYASISEAKRFLHVSGHRKREFFIALHAGHPFDGHELSKSPPPLQRSCLNFSGRQHEKGKPLMPNLCTHYLGVYHG